MTIPAEGINHQKDTAFCHYEVLSVVYEIAAALLCFWERGRTMSAKVANSSNET